MRNLYWFKFKTIVYYWPRSNRNCSIRFSSYNYI